MAVSVCWCFSCFFFFQAEDGIRDLVRSRGLGDVYKRQFHDSDANGIFAAATIGIGGTAAKDDDRHRAGTGLSLIHI